MAPVVVTGIVRYAINQELEGREVVNVLDYLVDDETSTPRAEACEAGAELILQAWDDYILALQTDDIVAQSVSWVDLDSLSGSTGNVTSGATASWPQAGSGGGDPLPANTAILVDKQVVAGRNTRGGRLFLAGMGESTTEATNGNHVTAVNVGLINTAFENLKDDTTIAAAGAPIEDMAGVVLHLPAGSSPSVDAITGWSCQTLVATQKSRLRS